MVSKPKIAVVIGDIGSAKELVPALLLLIADGVEVTFFADPAGKGIDVIQHAFPNTLISREFAWMGGLSRWDALVIGASATAVDAQIDWTRFGRANDTLVIWYEDLWGTAEHHSVCKVSPDLLLVVDDMAETIARRTRPDIETAVVGKPSFEELGKIDGEKAAQLRQDFRQGKGIGGHDIVVTYWGGGELERVVTHLGALVQSLEHDSRILIAPRLHPKMPCQSELWKLMNCLNMYGVRYMDVNSIDPSSLNCGSDVVLGEYGSTQTYAAALVGTMPLIALWPDNREERLLCGFHDGLPPLVEAGVGRSVVSHESLMMHILSENLWSASMNFQNRVRAIFGRSCEPGAALRIAQAIQSVL